MGYQTYIPDEWCEMREREQEAAAQAEAERTVVKQQRTSKFKKVLYTAGKTIGWVAVSLVAILIVAAGLLIYPPQAYD
jgi:cell division protein FtsL